MAVFRPDNHPSPIVSKIVPRSKPNQVLNSRRRRRSPSDEKRSEIKQEANELVMGKVRILKRGEKIDADRSGLVRVDKVGDVVLSSTDRLGPDPMVVKEEMKKVVVVKVKEVVVEDKFAGCVVVASPPPSSVPMPNNYWMKKEKYDPVSMAMDLRKMLRLDLI